MCFDKKISELEIKGYTIFPELLAEHDIASLKKEVALIPLTPVDYSDKQRVHHNFHLLGFYRVLELVAQSKIISFLDKLFGDDFICTSTLYAESHPGHPGIALHTDAQPYGSEIFGMQASAPILVRVLFYLDDLTLEKSPFRVIPHSHLSLHKDANPYTRYEAHPDQEVITCKAGTVVVINQKIFHGSLPNISHTSRALLAFAYRPAWASPIAKIDEWPKDKIQNIPAHLGTYFKSLNTQNIDFNVANRPECLGRIALGLNRERWSFRGIN